MTEAASVSQPQYDRAPIVEASLSIDILPISVDRYGLLGTTIEKLGAAYTQSIALSEFLGRGPQERQDVTGVLFSSSDGRFSVQSRSDGFTFSQQAPYDNWHAFLERAHEAWQAYKSVLRGVTPSAVSLKYINSIVIPLGRPLSDLFNTYPVLPQPGQLLDHLSMHYRYSLKEPLPCVVSVIMVYLGLSDDKQQGRMLLDNTFSLRVPGEEDLWKMMPTLREMKNTIFESQLKQELKGTFNA